MTFRKITSTLCLVTLAANSEPLITLQEANGTDKLRVELLNLEKVVALLRRSNGQEFKTPLAYLSEESRNEIRSIWTTHREKVEKHLKLLNKALSHQLFESNGKIWNEPARNVARRLRLPTESETPFTSSYRLYTRGSYSLAGAKPKTVVTYGDHEGRTLSISIIYSNKGNSLSTVSAGEDHFKIREKRLILTPSKVQ